MADSSTKKDTCVIHKDVLEDIFRHALEAYPEECCGIIIDCCEDGISRQIAHRFCNIQNRLHEEDPERFPFSASIAYTVDRPEAEGVFSSMKENGQTLAAFYHSHPDHPAFFSEEDKAAQTVLGEPEFPHAAQFVVSLDKTGIDAVKCFRWNTGTQDFDQCRIQVEAVR